MLTLPTTGIPNQLARIRFDGSGALRSEISLQAGLIGTPLYQVAGTHTIGIAWLIVSVDHYDAKFAVFDRDGTPVGATVQTLSHTQSGGFDLTWNGSEYVLVSEVHSSDGGVDIAEARFSEAGAATASRVLTCDGRSFSPRVAYSPGVHLVSYARHDGIADQRRLLLVK